MTKYFDCEKTIFKAKLINSLSAVTFIKLSPKFLLLQNYLSSSVLYTGMQPMNKAVEDAARHRDP